MTFETWNPSDIWSVMFPQKDKNTKTQKDVKAKRTTKDRRIKRELYIVMSGQFCTLAMFVYWPEGILSVYWPVCILASFALFKMVVYWPEGIGKSYQHTPPKRPQQNKRDGGAVFRIILLFCFKPLLVMESAVWFTVSKSELFKLVSRKCTFPWDPCWSGRRWDLTRVKSRWGAGRASCSNWWRGCRPRWSPRWSPRRSPSCSPRRSPRRSSSWCLKCSRPRWSPNVLLSFLATIQPGLGYQWC